MRVATLAAFAAGAAVALGAAWVMQRQAPAPLQAGDVQTIVAAYLRENPDAIVEALRAYQAQAEEAQRDEQRKAVAEHWEDLALRADDPVLGNPDGNVTLVEFFDYRCGYCRRALPDVMALKETDPQLRIVMKEFPILGPDSVIAARAALAARKQGKYAVFHEALMQAEGSLDEARILAVADEVGLDLDRLRGDMEAPEINATLRRNFELAEALGIRGTPAFVTRNDLVPGAVGADALKAMVNAARNDPG